ncbi:transcriptional regulator [Nocardioides sp.]|uniref:ArsR/SmtB family transcription factor n=1 Tax=Nocardioides sp. TaxID=35761 RepID=UPI002718B767|nr:helix-turn-helix domain-containing protein [Nocardioides sp.]MDO9456469.1 helix-turn-helix domain-containing protein [Nocardioides sp.]
MDGPTITPTPHQLRALAHPVRLRMLGMLRLDGPATATSLATRLGLNSGATSYHLRTLAQHGFVLDDAERGNGRERWWKAAHTSTYTQTAESGTEAADSEDAFLQSAAVVYTEWLQRAMEERPLLPQPWRDASTFSDWVQLVTPTKAKAVMDAVSEILEAVDDQPDEADARHVVFQFSAYVRPGQDH